MKTIVRKPILVDGKYQWLEEEIDLAQSVEERNIANQMAIDSCKQELASSDYKAIKYAEGLISAEDYAPIKAERQALRDRINELERSCKLTENSL